MDLLQDYNSDEDRKSDHPEALAGNTSNTPNDAAAPERPAFSGVVLRPDRRYLQAAPTVSLTAQSRKLQAQATASTAGTSTNKKSSTGFLIPFATSGGGTSSKSASSDLIILNNPTKDVLYQPIQGPRVMDPSRLGNMGVMTTVGDIQANVHVEETNFHTQRLAFARTGIAYAPNADGDIVYRTTLGYDTKRLQQFAAQEEQRRKRPRPGRDNDDNDDKVHATERLVYGSDDEVEFGIWAPPSQEERYEADNTVTDLARVGMDGLAPEQLAEREYIKERNRQRGIEEDQKQREEEGVNSFERLVERKMAHLLPPKMANDEPMPATTTFHGQQEYNYKGESWMVPPAGMGAIRADGDHIDSQHHKCFLPKKCVHRFTGHNKGVHRIRLFPGTGHLILSAGLDGKCKVWSVPDKQVMRTYIGHAAAVRDVDFNHDGTKFVSASFDRYLRLWKTESGEVLQTFTNKKVPYVVKFYPHNDNFFVVGCSDNKIVAYDATTAEITQEYNHHLAPVNAILFVTDHDGNASNTKMVTSSDDKKILVWEWDIGVPIKYISDPTMHSMPCLVMHPSEHFFVGQSLDNTIAVFQAGHKFALQRKKKFSGHIVSGYACEMCFSPDGRYLVSGDGNGAVFIWDWKKHQILQKYKAHTSGPAIACVWHPLEPSMLFTCGWDGIIKMWQ